MEAQNNDEKLWAGFSYLGMALCVIPTLIIFFVKKDESEFIKFASLQAIGLWVAGFVVGIVLMVLMQIPVLGALASLVVNLAFVGYWIYLMVKTFMGEEIEIPYLGAFIRSNFMA